MSDLDKTPILRDRLLAIVMPALFECADLQHSRQTGLSEDDFFSEASELVDEIMTQMSKYPDDYDKPTMQQIEIMKSMAGK